MAAKLDARAAKKKKREGNSGAADGEKTLDRERRLPALEDQREQKPSGKSRGTSSAGSTSLRKNVREMTHEEGPRPAPR